MCLGCSVDDCSVPTLVVIFGDYERLRHDRNAAAFVRAIMTLPERSSGWCCSRCQSARQRGRDLAGSSRRWRVRGTVLSPRAHSATLALVRTVGGLKLALEGATRDDRRVRFANVWLSAADAKDDVVLVTDSQGRMRYRLRDGEYVLRLTDGRESRFTVRDCRWTTIRIQLL